MKKVPSGQIAFSFDPEVAPRTAATNVITRDEVMTQIKRDVDTLKESYVVPDRAFFEQRIASYREWWHSLAN